jgi:predicted tellurium resistance membrane protein TerC
MIHEYYEVFKSVQKEVYMDDPILLAATAFALLIIPVLSFQLSKISLRYTFVPPVVAMVIAFPMFLFVVIVPTLAISKTLFIVSMSVWTGGFFGIFIAFFIYFKKKKTRTMPKNHK